jgi:hypothetical protein
VRRYMLGGMLPTSCFTTTTLAFRSLVMRCPPPPDHQISNSGMQLSFDSWNGWPFVWGVSILLSGLS